MTLITIGAVVAAIICALFAAYYAYELRAMWKLCESVKESLAWQRSETRSLQDRLRLLNFLPKEPVGFYNAYSTPEVLAREIPALFPIVDRGNLRIASEERDAEGMFVRYDENGNELGRGCMPMVQGFGTAGVAK